MKNESLWKKGVDLIQKESAKEEIQKKDRVDNRKRYNKMRDLNWTTSIITLDVNELNMSI